MSFGGWAEEEDWFTMSEIEIEKCLIKKKDTFVFAFKNTFVNQILVLIDCFWILEITFIFSFMLDGGVSKIIEGG